MYTVECKYGILVHNIDSLWRAQKAASRNHKRNPTLTIVVKLDGVEVDRWPGLIAA